MDLLLGAITPLRLISTTTKSQPTFTLRTTRLDRQNKPIPKHTHKHTKKPGKTWNEIHNN